MSRIISAMFRRLRDPAQLSPDRCSDSDLVARFVRNNDSAALELLFLRHGPLVWSVCCRVLGASADAEDAFQTTFVVLARKARTIVHLGAFAGWLHQVALRSALTVRKTRSRQMSREFSFENDCDVPQDYDPSHRLQAAELNDILDRELARLPKKYRMPLILCDLENWMREAAAVELKCPLGTLNSRLARGREMLRLRLQKCGVTFTGLAAVLMVPTGVSATWQHLRTCPPKSVQQLADSTMRSMALAGMRKAFATFALCGMLIVGTTLMAMGIADDSKNPSSQTKEPVQNLSAAPEEKKEVASRFIDPNAGPLPEGAVARIGSNRLRHAGEVTGLKYSLDGKWLASISTARVDATARLWNAATGKQQLVVKIETVQEDQTSPGEVSRALGFSKDGKQFFVIDMASFRAFDIDSGKELFAHAFPKKEPQGKARRPFFRDVNGAAISPDGKTYVLIQREGLLEIRDVATGKVLKTAEHSFQRYRYVPIEFSPDSRHIVVGNREVEGELPLPVIEVETGKTVNRIEGADILTSLRFVPGTDKLMGMARKADEPSVNILDRKTGKSLGSINVDNMKYQIEVAPDGKTLIAAGNGQASQIIDIDTGKEIARIPSTPSLRTLAFSPDGKLLAGARAYSGAITVWDMATRDYHATAAEPTGFFGVHFGPDSNTLAIPERGHPLLDWRTGKIVERLAQSNDERPWRRGILSPNRQWFAKRESEDMSISVVDAKTGKEYRNFKGHKEFVQSLSFSPDESRLATGSYDKTIRVWSLKTGEEIAQFTSPDLTGHEGIALSDNGHIMAVGVNQGLKNGSGSIIIIWDVDAKKQLARFEDETWFFYGVAVSPDGKWLAAGGGRNRHDMQEKIDETAVHIWETATGRLVHTLPGHNCQYVRPGALCTFSPDSRWLATGDAAGKLRIWEVLSGEEVRSFSGHHSIVTAQFSPDGKLLVAASDDAPCFIWDVLNTSSQAKKLTEAELQGSWDNLEKADAKIAFRAIGRLAANPDLAVELLRKNLKPAVAIEPTLRKQLSSSESPEERTRLEQILKKSFLSPKRRQQIRALSALEFIGNPEAIKLLDELAAGAKEDILTRAVIDVRERLGRRK